ncbi:hypothetical protein AAHB56_28335 [Bacillus thuringiensis]
MNGVLQEGADPELGFPLNDLPTGASVIVTFEVLIDEIPLGNNVVNSAECYRRFPSKSNRATNYCNRTK